MTAWPQRYFETKLIIIAKRFIYNNIYIPIYSLSNIQLFSLSVNKLNLQAGMPGDKQYVITYNKNLLKKCNRT